MTDPIRIAAALIEDGAGRLLLVRKAGTRWFMQAGGKVEPGETSLAALLREVQEEIGLTIGADQARHVGRFRCDAANEPGRSVDAEVFHIRTTHRPDIRAEIEEALWVTPAEAAALPLAPLTRDHLLPLVATL